MADKQELKKVQVETAKEMIQKTFGENLFALMAAKKITQKELAAAVGVTAATLSSYKNGSKSPTLPVAVAIAKALNVSLDWLCGTKSTDISEREVETYSSAIRLLIELSRMVDINLLNESETCEKLDESARIRSRDPELTEDIYIKTNDLVLLHFLKEWKNVKALFDSHVIDSNIYDPWIAQQLKDYDCLTDEIPDKLQEEYPPF